MRFDYKFLAGLGTCLGFGLGAIYTKMKPKVAFSEPQDMLAYDCPYLKWDYEWDKMSKGKNAKGNGKSSKFTRTIWLINDVQHHRSSTDCEQKPTSVGKLQGRLCAATIQRLKTIGVKWDTVYYSTMVRTGFQVNLIRKALDDKDVVWKSSELLVEGLPVEVSPKKEEIPSGREFSKYYHQDHPRIEAAFRIIFSRPNSEQKNDSHDMVVTHPNVIRYFLCRALQMPPEALSRFTLGHGSFTKIKINGDGYVSVEGIGDAGHLPPTLLTSGELKGCPPTMVDPDVSRQIYKEGHQVDGNIPEADFERLLDDYEDHAKAAKMIS